MNEVRTVDLRAEAIAEVSRLAKARAGLRDGDHRALVQLDGDATWIALARRTTRRRSLGRRVCLVWRVAFEDASGRLIESRLVPVVIELASVPGTAQRRAWIVALLRHVDADIRARVDAASGDWREAAARVAGAFTSARLCREHAIAGRPPGTSGSASQPGLFDRRAERSHLAQAATIAASAQAAAERLQTIGALATIVPQPARLLLVLVP
jgi:hypothetical protein